MAIASECPDRTRIGQRWLIAGLLLVFGIIYVQYALKLNSTDQGSRSAFLRWRAQLEDLDEGVNVWEKHAYPNPPIMVILLDPFVRLPPTLGASLWFACKTLLAIFAIILVLKLLDSACGPGEQFPLWGKGLAVVMSLRPIEGDLVHGNVNLLILFLVVAACYAYCHHRDALAGLLIALGIACKLTPALFLLYLLWKRAWTALFASAVGLVIFVLLIPAFMFGWSNNLDYLESWHRHMIAPYAAGIVSSEHKNQSLPGFLHRMLSDEPSFSDYEGDRKIVLEKDNVVSWSLATVQGIVVASMIAFALLAMAFFRTSGEGRPRLEVLAEASVVILGMLLFSERTWKHHCVTLLLPFGVLAFAVSSARFSRGTRWYFGITLAAVALLMLSTSTGILDQHLHAHDRIGKQAQVYGAYVWAFLLLLASMFVVLRKTRRIQ